MGRSVLLPVLLSLALVPLAGAEEGSTATFKIDLTTPGREVAKIESTFPMAGTTLSFYISPTEENPDGEAALVENVSVRGADGRELAVTYIGTGDWSLAERIDEKVTVTYDVRLDHDAYSWRSGIEEVAYKTEDAIFAVADAYLMTPASGQVGRSEIRLVIPEDWQASVSWRKGEEEGVWIANDLQELLRNFFMVGDHHIERVEIGDFEVEMAFTRDLEGDVPAFTEVMERVLAEYMEIFGGARSDSYVVAARRETMNDGGAFVGGYSMRIEGDINDDTRVVWGHGVAHEVFHLWNGITINPSGQEEWFREGFTDYMTIVTLFRTGLIDEVTLFKKLENIERKVELGRRLQGIEGSIRAAGDNKSQNRLLVYGGGALLAFGLDVEMRQASGNEAGVRDLLGRMYEEFGVPEIGYEMDDVRRLAEELSGADLRAFFERYVDGDDPISMKPWLRELGLGLSSFVEEAYIYRRPDASLEERSTYDAIFSANGVSQ